MALMVIRIAESELFKALKFLTFSWTFCFNSSSSSLIADDELVDEEEDDDDDEEEEEEDDEDDEDDEEEEEEDDEEGAFAGDPLRAREFAEDDEDVGCFARGVFEALCGVDFWSPFFLEASLLDEPL